MQDWLIVNPSLVIWVPFKGEIARRKTGVLISDAMGEGKVMC
jgi:hypothetical protein